ncbi:MAG: hypothetical protein HY747_10400 [Elusimicrobia bacterium]|nr:hypothetical protein [Elusimicrobiota bacterium]
MNTRHLRIRLKTTLSVLKGIRFSSPPKSEVIVFDLTASDRLVTMVLPGIGHVILPSPADAMYLSPVIVLLMLKNLKYWGEMRLGQLFVVYLVSCLEYIRPKIVITFQDNNSFFWRISRLYRKAEFLAMQQGNRTPEDLLSRSQHPCGCLPDHPRLGSKILMPHFYCWGRYQEKIYKQYGHDIDHFYPVGPLIGGYYKTEVSDNSGAISYDLCLVSEYRKEIANGMCYRPIKTGQDRYLEFVAKYVRTRSLRLAVASHSHEQEAQNEFFLKIFGSQAKVIPYSREKLSTYEAMDHSNVVIAQYSAAAYEAAGWGKKVFFCNFTGIEFRDCPAPGFWSISNPDYSDFERKLDALLAMDQGDFERQAEESMKYFMNFDPAKPAHRVIRERILKILAHEPKFIT